MWKKSLCLALSVLLFQGKLIGAWTITTCPAGVQPSSSFGTGGAAEINSSYGVEVRRGEYALNATYLCSKSGNTGYMDVTWSKNFDPDVDYGFSWPVDSGNNTLWVVLIVEEIEDQKAVNCNTPG